MKTLENIKQEIISQSLINTCACDNLNEFSKYTTVEALDVRIQMLNKVESVKDFPIYYITYNYIEDEFQFNILFVKKENNQLTYTEEQLNLVKWIKENNNSYMLTYSNGSAVGHAFSYTLPIIIKNF